METPRVFGLTGFLRRILGPASFPLRKRTQSEAEPQVYQPPVVPKPPVTP